jgi:hypothetical protein
MVSLYPNGAVDIAALMRLAIEYPAEFLRLLRTALYALLVETASIPARRILRSRLRSPMAEKTSANPQSSSLEVNTAESKAIWHRAG